MKYNKEFKAEALKLSDEIGVENPPCAEIQCKAGSVFV